MNGTRNYIYLIYNLFIAILRIKEIKALLNVAINRVRNEGVKWQ